MEGQDSYLERRQVGPVPPALPMGHRSEVRLSQKSAQIPLVVRGILVARAC